MPPGHIRYSDTRPDASSYVRSPLLSTSGNPRVRARLPAYHPQVTILHCLSVCSSESRPVTSLLSAARQRHPAYTFSVHLSITLSVVPSVRPSHHLSVHPHVRHPDPDFLPTFPPVATHPFTPRHIASAVRDSALPSPGIWSKSWCNQPRGLAPPGQPGHPPPGDQERDPRAQIPRVISSPAQSWKQ